MLRLMRNHCAVLHLEPGWAADRPLPRKEDKQLVLLLHDLDIILSL